MKKRFLFLIIVLLLLCSLTVLAKNPSDKWPTGVNLWYMDETQFFNSMDGYFSASGIEKNATQGAISPNGKYIAYVKKGPNLLVERCDNGKQVMNIPWGIHPIWSSDGKYIYYAKIDKVVDNMDLFYFQQSVGLYRTSFPKKEIKKITSNIDIPESFDQRTNTLYFTRTKVDGDNFFTSLFKYSPAIKRVESLDLNGRFPLISANNHLAYSGPTSTVAYTQQAVTKNFNLDSLKENKVTIKAIHRDKDSAIANTFNKTGSYLLIQLRYKYKKNDPAAANKFFWGLDVYNTKTGELRRFIDKKWSFSEARFRQKSNQLIFTSDLSW